MSYKLKFKNIIYNNTNNNGIKLKYISIFLLISSSFALLSIYYLSFVYSIKPCKLCFYQRNIYYILLILSTNSFLYVTLYLKNKNKFKNFDINITPVIIKTTYILSIILLLLELCIAVFHFGVEKNWWKYDSNCIAAFSASVSFKDYVERLNGVDLVACNVSQMDIFSISIVGWNVIYTVGVLLILFWLIKNNPIGRVKT